MQMGLYCMGNLKEKFFKDACAEYQKRLSAGFELREFKEERLSQNPSAEEIRQALEQESEAVLKKLPKDAVLVLLTKEGKEYESEDFAEKIVAWQQLGGPIVFFIGSSYGIGEALRKRADHTVSFSKFTFPHQLMRVICLEQLYRAQCITAGTQYHK